MPAKKELTIQQKVDEAYNIMSKPLTSRDVMDLEVLENTKRELSKFIAPSHMLKVSWELEADQIEKMAMLSWKKEKVSGRSKMNDQDIKAYARVQKNNRLLEVIQSEYDYNSVLNAYKELDTAIINTRMIIRSTGWANMD